MINAARYKPAQNGTILAESGQELEARFPRKAKESGGNMRYLFAAILTIMMATPAFAESCSMEGPHNCVEMNDAQLIATTKNTIHQMQLTHEQHAFRTQNDYVLEMAARQHAQLAPLSSVADQPVVSNQ